MPLIEFLKSNFPFASFRGSQESVIQSILDGHDVLALMPTGQGKSLCYQFLAKWFSLKSENQITGNLSKKSLTLVVSPLIALMQDQVTQATKLGLDATFLSSLLTKDERFQRQLEIKEGRYNLILVTPERFRKPEFWQCLEGREINLMAVDEAHCISQWGHDFRPDYTRLGGIRQSLKMPRVLALTATATPLVQKEIQSQLGFQNPVVISDGLERHNIAIRVHEIMSTEEKLELLVKLLREPMSQGESPGAVLIYASLIDTVHKISRFLNKANISHRLYHGDLNPSQRQGNLKAFQREPAPVMVATPAFGLGIDKQNVRQVFHFEIPGSLESYFQEIGRAGRDGKKATANLLFDDDDVSIQMEFIKWSHPDDEFIARVFYLIEKNGSQIQQEGFDFLREQMNFKNRRDFRAEAAVNILERWGCLERTLDPFPFRIVRPPEAEDFAKEKGALQFKHQNQKLLEMLRWAQNAQECRLVGIYNYFGHSGSPCGICDVCQS
ncbi:MAG: RecQ family ATP-dependent DNA helicase [Bdellovibrionales bacterium]|nr:RecQ family ATP-dependent DNA helicase [Bdellovibrionales bacterium]